MDHVHQNKASTQNPRSCSRHGFRFVLTWPDRQVPDATVQRAVLEAHSAIRQQPHPCAACTTESEPGGAGDGAQYESFDRAAMGGRGEEAERAFGEVTRLAGEEGVGGGVVDGVVVQFQSKACEAPNSLKDRWEPGLTRCI